MAKLIASLGMYDGGDLTAANDTLWSALAKRLQSAGIADVPAALSRELPLPEIWSHPGLIFGQTCGYPFARHYSETLTVLGTPSYDAPGCEGPMHGSFIVVPAASSLKTLSDLREVRAVINDVESNTGRQLFGDAVAELGECTGPFFRSVRVSGSHAESLRMVADGEVDAASIDCVTYAHIERAHPEQVARTRVVHTTRKTPSLPLVMASGLGAEIAAVVTRSLNEVLRDPAAAPALRTLRLTDVTQLAPSVYQRTLAFRDRADAIF